MKDGVVYNASTEQYTTSFTTMLGDQAKAQQLVNDLKITAAKTPFGMEDLAKNTQTLMAFGISADEAKLRLGQLGDISQGGAQKLESLTLAFAQVSSAGKLSGQDLLQMINAEFNPLQEMSKKTGKSVGELKEKMEKARSAPRWSQTPSPRRQRRATSFMGRWKPSPKPLAARCRPCRMG